MSNDYSVKAHAKALLKGPTAKMDEATRQAREGRRAAGMDDTFGEDVGHGFPGGGAQSSAVQLDDLVGVGSAARHGGELVFRMATKAGAAKEAFDHAPQLAQLYREISQGAGRSSREAGERLAAGVEADNPLMTRAKAALNAFATRNPQSLAKDQELQQLAARMQRDMQSPQAAAVNARIAKADGAGALKKLNTAPNLAQNTPSAPDAVTKAAGAVTPDKAQRWLANHAAGKPAGEFVQPEQVQAHAAVLQHFIDLAGGAK